ncbi:MULTISPECIES: polysaccharide deacetylase family protein [unclassified Pseudofrankia]|uniref:polysaccharide deacetylase family protein n=1 Tax=unclassified Pseudofrankia TaxID=2994372 RepID=UPI001F51BC1E|nr:MULTISPECIES: polysaccharide deacetylase family protein [unclassified Pseudofrankia]MDT3444259.1 polysaccharide deacetylase family protein [Pseudofrankia sp. BMG5.37]
MTASREAVTIAGGPRGPARRALVGVLGLPVGAVVSWPAVAGAAVVAGLGYGLPAVTALRGVRGRLTPALAGFGAADHVALTFDDGPDPRSTPHFLEVLEELEIRATFFVLGDAVSRAPGLVVDMAAAGHELAIHGWDRKPMLLRGPLSTYDQLARTHELVAAATGRPPRFVRPPHGILSAAVLAAARRLELTPVLWTARGRDWEAGATPLSVLAAVGPDLRGGATILLHDSDRGGVPGAWRSALGALPELACRCADAALRLGPLAEHGLPGHPPQARVPR